MGPGPRGGGCGGGNSELSKVLLGPQSTVQERIQTTIFLALTADCCVLCTHARPQIFMYTTFFVKIDHRTGAASVSTGPVKGMFKEEKWELCTGKRRMETRDRVY